MQRRSLRDLDGNELGFIESGIKFWTCAPQLYRISQPTFDRGEHDRYLREIHGFDGEYLQAMEQEKGQFVGTDGDNLFESGARDCYLSYGKGRDHVGNITNVRESRHGSVFEHGMVVIKTACVSRGLTHELVRHRVGVSISQVSSRYVDPKLLGFVVPPLMREHKDLAEEFVEASLSSLHTYNNHVRELRERLKDKFPFASRTDLRKKARGAARANLPIGLAQVMQYGMNLRIARHILYMRGAAGAEEEIVGFAESLVPIVERVWPEGCADIEVASRGVEVGAGSF